MLNLDLIKFFTPNLIQAIWKNIGKTYEEVDNIEVAIHRFTIQNLAHRKMLKEFTQ